MNVSLPNVEVRLIEYMAAQHARVKIMSNYLFQSIWGP